MLKKTITYENPFTEQEITEVHFFHISKADMITLEMSEHKLKYTGKDGKEYTGWMAKLQRIVDSEDGKGIMQELSDIIRRAYGRKDGDFFRKSPQILSDFEGSGAFGQLLFELCTNADIAGDFVNQVFPKNLEAVAAEVQAAIEEREKEENADASDKSLTPPTPIRTETEVKVLTQAEARELTPEELQAGLTDGRYKLS